MVTVPLPASPEAAPVDDEPPIDIPIINRQAFVPVVTSQRSRKEGVSKKRVSWSRERAHLPEVL